MKSWQLPEHVADVLPTNARQLESARERLLAFSACMVMNWCNRH